ncbi:hypothetical protein Aph01nite_63100 [Acrocarpospora phusangensis]|uniref:Uncharacterized protein n=1 Tax=Acrocarpospora phusangensis TaxID=1070424 RepID=A0A919QKI9_9ACTN|nr:hypothetical protein Aph01nite_63100 [Acrocarpospora phusangensis]
MLVAGAADPDAAWTGAVSAAAANETAPAMAMRRFNCHLPVGSREHRQTDQDTSVAQHIFRDHTRDLKLA